MTDRIALLQMVSGPDMKANLREAERLLREAAASGARLAVLPENVALMAEAFPADLEHQVDGFLEHLAGLARSLGLWVVAGTLPLRRRSNGELVPDGRVRQACLVLNDMGALVARYDKIHLFDVDVSDAQGSYRESQRIEPGSDIVVVDTPVGRLGLAICYDLRFPELFRKLVDEGAELVALPSAFTRVTGEAHWEPLIRARSIENQIYMLACGQGGQHSPVRTTWGHSMVVDPWGRVLASAELGAQIVTAETDQSVRAELQGKMPVLKHRVF